MSSRWRKLQLLTGIHRIHHIRWSYGWKLPFVKRGFFDDYGWRREIYPSAYHDCTTTGEK